jgi:hypothetical protein
MSRAIQKSSKRTRAPLPRTPTLQPHLVDPVITLTASADRLLDEYIKARNAVELAEAKLPARDRRWPSVAAPALGLLRGEWSSDFLFTSVRHIDREFQRVTKRLKDEIKQGRGKKLSGQLAHEYNERIARNQMVLAALPKFKGPLKRELRQEQRRLVVLARHVDQLEFIDVMLGDQPALTPQQAAYQRMLTGDPIASQFQSRPATKPPPAVDSGRAFGGRVVVVARRRSGSAKRAYHVTGAAQSRI